jgi:uncharacterized protein
MPTRDQWLLLALAHRHGAPMTPVQVQKTMFLMKEEAPSLMGSEFYSFEPYNYGPFNAEIYHDLEDLQKQGLVVIDGTGSVRSFAVTAGGLERAAEIKKSADPTAAAFLENVVDWVTSLSFSQLVRAIYAKYPKYKVNSVFSG